MLISIFIFKKKNQFNNAIEIWENYAALHLHLNIFEKYNCEFYFAIYFQNRFFSAMYKCIKCINRNYVFTRLKILLFFLQNLFLEKGFSFLILKEKKSTNL